MIYFHLRGYIWLNRDILSIFICNKKKISIQNLLITFIITRNCSLLFRGHIRAISRCVLIVVMQFIFPEFTADVTVTQVQQR